MVIKIIENNKKKETNEKTAIKHGFKNFNEYRKVRDNEWSKRKGFKNISEYVSNLNHLKGKSLPMDKNTTCSSYLGVHVAEKLLPDIFKSPKMMPYGNPGYDAVCKEGYKINIKSSCMTESDGIRASRWLFPIRKNKNSDYFLLISFNNRKDLKILHIWLINGSENIIRQYNIKRKLNNFSMLSISNLKESLKRFKKYELSKDKIKKANKFIALKH